MPPTCRVLLAVLLMFTWATIASWLFAEERAPGWVQTAVMPAAEAHQAAAADDRHVYAINPPDVIRDLGRYSLSGGIWHGDVLLVTGHDDPVVHALRLPEEGSVLQLLDRHPVR